MSTRRRIEFELVGNAGNIEAVLNRLNSGITQTARGASGVNRELGMMDRNLMAIKTTARYALAGGLIFGITGAISRLRDFQDRLAQVAALSGSVNRSTGSYQAPSANFLGRVGDQALLMSNQLGIATSDVQDYMSRFFSAFDVQRMGGNEKLVQMRNFVNEVGQLQASLGAEAGDPQQLAGGIAGLVRQIDPKGRNIGKQTNRVSNLIWQMLAQTPNITGRDISRDVGRIGATMTIANMTPEQVFAVWTQAGQAGGSASVIGRGVAQLLGTSLLHPQTPAQIKAFQQAGLPTDPTTLRNMGGFQVLQRMMQAVAPNGATVSNPLALGNEDIPDDQAAAASGVKGVNLTLLYNLLGRQESVRQFIALLAQQGVPGLKEHIRTQKSANAADQAHQRELAAQRQRILSQTAQAASNLPLQLVRQLRYPLEHLIAPGLISASNLAAEHPRATQAVEATLGTVLAAAGARRLWKAFRKGGAAGGLAGAAGAAITAEELPSLLAGGAADGSRHNPFWVVIAPVSGTLDPKLGGGDNKTKDSITAQAEKLAGRLGGPAAAALAAVRGVGWRGALRIGGRGAAEVTAAVEFQKQVVNRLTGTPQNSLPSFFGWNGRFGQGPNVSAVERAMQNNNKQTWAGDHYFKGALDMDIRMVDAQGRTISTDKKRGVPVKMIPDKGAPTAQGKTGQRKGTH